MKKNKQGYTLAEILITLAIIGVAAALTMPALIGNAGRRSIIPARDRAVNLLQNSMADIIDHAQSNNGGNSSISTLAAIREQDIFPNNATNNFLVDSNIFRLFDLCRGITGMEELSDADRNAYLNTLGNLTATYPNLTNGRCKIYRFKKTNQYIIVEQFPDIPNTVADDAIITRIFIDSDGNNGNNSLDNDLFVYGLGNNGYIYAPDTAECNSGQLMNCRL